MPYCDFNSHVRDSVDQDRWRAALLADMAHEAALLPGRRLSSIFFGGGTPSLMPPATVAALIAAAERHWGFAPDMEITLGSQSFVGRGGALRRSRGGGDQPRLAGAASLDDAALSFLGRAHGVAEGLAALGSGTAAFDRVSFDLIYALPGQSVVAWQAMLASALAFGTGHLSLYQLTIEPGTRFATMAANGSLVPTDPDHAADLFEATRAMTAAAGLPAYEISNHARSGEESRHNLTYWRQGDYAGIGPGAHGRRNGAATVRHRKPENWLAAIDRRGDGIVSEDALSSADRATEALLMGLRLAEGVDLARIARRTGMARDRLVDPVAVERLAALGLLSAAGDRLTVSEAACCCSDAILPQVVAV